MREALCGAALAGCRRASARRAGPPASTCRRFACAWAALWGRPAACGGLSGRLAGRAVPGPAGSRPQPERLPHWESPRAASSVFRTIALCLAFAAAAAAQNWEAGGAGALGFSSQPGVKSPDGSANAGIAPGPGASAYAAHNLYRRLSGEIRYTFQQGDLRLSAASREARFAAIAHSITYEVLVHARSSESRVRPFLAAGAGYKQYRGTGTESAYQPLGRIALLTLAREWKPAVVFGGGVKLDLAPRVTFRVEFRDYLTRFPQKVIAPAPGAEAAGWLHGFMPMAGLGVRF